MKKTLCLDFGNTRLKYAIFDKDIFMEENMLTNGDIVSIEALLQKYQPQKAILSSVIDHDPAIETLLSEKTIFHKLSHLTKLNFTSNRSIVKVTYHGSH